MLLTTCLLLVTQSVVACYSFRRQCAPDAVTKIWFHTPCHMILQNQANPIGCSSNCAHVRQARSDWLPMTAAATGTPCEAAKVCVRCWNTVESDVHTIEAWVVHGVGGENPHSIISDFDMMRLRAEQTCCPLPKYGCGFNGNQTCKLRDHFRTHYYVIALHGGV